MMSQKQIRNEAEAILKKSPAFRSYLDSQRDEQLALRMIERAVRMRANNPRYAR